MTYELPPITGGIVFGTEDEADMGLREEFQRMRDEIERLNGEVKCLHETIGLIDRQHAAEIERLRAAIEGLMKQPWKSIDKDNMEYQVIVSCYVRDALLAALEPKP